MVNLPSSLTPKSRRGEALRQGRAKTFGDLIRLRDALMKEVPCHSGLTYRVAMVEINFLDVISQY